MFRKKLAHVTTEENCNQIKKTHKFRKSAHANGSNLWLGDGIYFWDASSKKAIKVGKKLVKNKKENKGKKIMMITLPVAVPINRYMDLDSEVWNQYFCSFLDETFQEGKDLLILLQKNNNARYSYKNKLGRLLGNALNLFVKVLEEEKNIQVDLVSFCLFSLTQYCIKNESILEKIKHSYWDFEYI